MSIQDQPLALVSAQAGAITYHFQTVGPGFHTGRDTSEDLNV